jgi:hypothetical protein
MSTATARQIEIEDRPVVGLRLAGPTYLEPNDATQGRQIGSHRHDDATQGWTLEEDPRDDATRGHPIRAR